MRFPVLAALVATLALAACGDDSDSDSGGEAGSAGLAEALTYLKPNSPTIYAVDVDAARSELGLPDDADATDLDALQDLEFDDPEYQLIEGVAATMPGRDEFASSLVVPELLEALDGTQISAAVNDRRADNEVAVIVTSQPFDEIAEALEGSYTREGSTLQVNDEKPSAARVDDLGDGMILVTGRDVDADALIADTPGGVPEGEAMIGDDGGSLAFLGEIEAMDGCLLATAITASADSTSGTIGLHVDGEADPDAVDTATIEESVGPIDLGTPTADGSVVRIPYTAEVDPGTPSPGFEIYSQFLFFDLYQCPG